MIFFDIIYHSQVNRKLNSKNSFKEFHSIERVILYAISLGNMSNNCVGAIAGSFAGAFYSLDNLPNYLFEICVSLDDVSKFAQKLYNICKVEKYPEIRNLNF